MMLSRFSPKKKNPAYSQLEEDEHDGLELIPKSQNRPPQHAPSSAGDEELPMQLDDLDSLQPGQEESMDIRTLDDLKAAIKEVEKAIRPKIIGSIVVLAMVIAIVLAFNPGGKVDHKHAIKPPENLCHYQGSRLPEGRFTVNRYSLLLLLGPHLLAPEPPLQPSFQGEAAINATLLQVATCMLIHGSSVNISTINVTIWPPRHSPGDTPPPTTCLCGAAPGCHSKNCSSSLKEPAPGSGLVAVPLGKTVRAGSTVVLQAQYQGGVAGPSQQQGLFRSAPYALPGGGKAVLLSTQLELYNSRLLFPSLDEPGFKATFEVRVAVPSRTQVLFNTPASSRGPYAGGPAGWGAMEVVAFQETPPMPTYTLGLAVGPLGSQSAITKSQTQVQLWAPPGRETHLGVALKVAVAALEFYEAWTGVVLPLPKFDLVAVPGRGGAMESWGLLLFDSSRMLVSPTSEGAWGMWRSADVICHELAHQWFGNYVTCSSEEEMVVNEGVASLMEYGCVEAVAPALSSPLLMHRALNPLGGPLGSHEGVRHQALTSDADPWATPIRGSPDSAPFSVATYSKGAAILSMAGRYLDAFSPGAFQAGLRQYLRQFALGSASVLDLLTALAGGVPASMTAAAAKDRKPTKGADEDGMERLFDAQAFVDGMLNWTVAPGYPLVRVGDDDPIILTQERFCAWGQLSPDLRTTSCPTTVASWYLPLFVAPLAPPSAQDPTAPPAPANSTTEVVLMASGSLELPDDVETEGDPWVVQKGSGGGPFRVLYPPLQRVALHESLKELNFTGMPGLQGQAEAAADAASVVDDIMQLALAAPSGGTPLVTMVEALQWAESVLKLPETSTGIGGYALLPPVLQALHTLVDLLAAEFHCPEQLRRFSTQLLQPCAVRLLAALPDEQSGGAYMWEAGGKSREEAFQRLLLAPVVTLSALLGDTTISEQLCMDTPPPPARPSSPGKAAELQDAAALVSAARPVGCRAISQTAMGVMLASWEQQWVQQQDEAEAYRALAALAHAGGGAFARGEPHGRTILLALLDLPGGSMTLPAVPRALAIAHAATMAHTAHLLGTVNGTSSRIGSGPAGAAGVLALVREHWEQLESSWGSSAWQLLEEVAAVAVTTQERYGALRQWLMPQKEAAAAAANRSRQQRALQVLSRAHGNMLWRSSQAIPTCAWLSNWHGV